MPAHGRVQLVDLLGQLAGFLLREPLELTGLAPGLEGLEALDPALDGHEVGEQAAQPAGVDVMLAGSVGLVADGLLGLLLRPHEQDRLAAACRLADELERVVEARYGLGQVDDVDPVALGEDVLAHLGIPAAGLVSEVDARLEQLLHARDSHGFPPVLSLGPRHLRFGRPDERAP